MEVAGDVDVGGSARTQSVASCIRGDLFAMATYRRRGFRIGCTLYAQLAAAVRRRLHYPTDVGGWARLLLLLASVDDAELILSDDMTLRGGFVLGLLPPL